VAAAWDRVADAQARRKDILRQTATLNSELFGAAQTLVLMATEDTKASPDRLREFRDSNRESLERDLFSPAPVYADLEVVKLADSLAQFMEFRGGNNELVSALLSGKSPRERAADAIEGTKLGDPEYRRQLAAPGKDGIEKSSDPLIAMARTLDAEYRRLRAITDELDEIERQAYAQITEAVVAIHGTSGYPDATFTLRLAFGTVKGYIEDGKTIPPQTTVHGAVEHQLNHKSRAPWLLPESWTKGIEKLSPDTPFNFVCTADIIGGNSGSPVVNRKGELVGLIFDGNIQSLTSDFFYDETVSRAVAVHSSIIPAALRHIYGAERLADELGK
jgi:hypothetical protein